MSLKKIGQVKTSKFFRVWDLIIYGAILAVVVALIIAFTVKRDKGGLTGFVVEHDGEVILTYRFGEDLPDDGEYIKVKESGEDSFTLRFAEGDSYNDIFVDTKDKRVWVLASNCSAHKDCVYTSPLTSNGSIPIICTVHKLIISPVVYYDDGKIEI